MGSYVEANSVREQLSKATFKHPLEFHERIKAELEPLSKALVEDECRCGNREWEKQHGGGLVRFRWQSTKGVDLRDCLQAIQAIQRHLEDVGWELRMVIQDCGHFEVNAREKSVVQLGQQVVQFCSSQLL
uniref:Uncharacterized protein n=1 Tax=Fagus sylvatica TaxID=28930 RepID=A0A2N9I3P1_FAGSY